MSARLSTGLPRACSGLMYAAVPRIIPAWVIAGVVIVGDCDALATSLPRRFRRLGEAEVQNFHRAIVPHLDVRGFQIAVDDPLLVRGFERLGDLLRDGQGLIDRDRARARCAATRSSPSTSSITSAVTPPLSSRPWMCAMLG